MDLDKAEIIAKEALKKFGLNDWKFYFDRAKLRFGKCNYTKKEISLSKHLTALNDEFLVFETILHEIAHALAGHKAGHGKKWKTIVEKIGGKPSRCFSSSSVQIPNLKFTAQCLHCDCEFQVNKPKVIACKSCCQQFNKGKYSAKFAITFVEN